MGLGRGRRKKVGSLGSRVERGMRGNGRGALTRAVVAGMCWPMPAPLTQDGNGRSIQSCYVKRRESYEDEVCIVHAAKLFIVVGALNF